MKSFRIIENPSELGAGTRGSSVGIDGLRIAAINNESKLFYENEVVTIDKNNKLLFKKINTPHAIRLKQIYKRLKKLGNEVESSLRFGRFPLVISGDHSSAAGTIAGIKKAYPDMRLGLVWIDAHADMHTPYTTPSGNVHGMPLAMSMGLDNLKHKRNDISEKAEKYWEKCKNLFDMSPKVNPEDLVFIGLRSYEKEELALIEEHNVKAISVSEVRNGGIDKALDATLDHLKQCDAIYLSLDVDSMDPNVTSYGTGTPVAKGFTPDEVIEMVAKLLKNDIVKALELCEINPLLDDSNRMAEISLVILEDIINIINTE